MTDAINNAPADSPKSSAKRAELRRTLNEITGRYPAILLLAGVFCGITPVANGFGIIALSPSILGTLLAWWWFRSRGLWHFGLAALAALVSTAIACHLPGSDYRRVVTGNYCGAEIRFTVTDESCGGSKVEWLDSPGWIFGRVTAMRFSSSDHWQTVSGDLAIHLPDGAQQPGYGDILFLRGAFTPPPVNLKETVFAANGTQIIKPISAFDFYTFLKARGISHIFRAEEVRRDGYQPSITASLLTFRNFLLLRTAEHVESLQNRNLLSGLIFGCRQCLDSKSRYDYIRTGTIHIFTVGGFHVGILAFMLLWMLRWIPFTPRYLLVPLLMAAYVATTGFTPPTVRTLIMFGIWSVCRGLLLQTPALNIIFFSAAGILLCNPFYLFDLGFQYSFTVVAFLVAAGKPIASWVGGIDEKNNWIPRAAVTIRQRWTTALKRSLAAAVAGCMVAWLASTGISVYYQGLLFPAGPGLNLLIVPFVWLIFLAAGLKMLLPPMVELDSLLAKTLDWLTGTMGWLCESCSRFLDTVYLNPPSGRMVVVFSVVLLLLITARKRWVFIASSLAMILFPAWWHLSGRLQTPSVSFMTGGGNPPAILFSNPERQYHVAVNVPGDSARFMGALVKERGSGDINLAFLSGTTREYCAGLPSLSIGLKIRELALAHPRSNSLAGQLLPELLADGTIISLLPKENEDFAYRSPLLRIFRQNSALRLEYGRSGFKITAGYRQSDDGGVWLETGDDNRIKWSTELDSTARNEIRTVRF